MSKVSDSTIAIVRRALSLTEGQVYCIGYDRDLSDVLYYTCRRNKRQLFTFTTNAALYEQVQVSGGRWHRVVFVPSYNDVHYDWNKIDPRPGKDPPKKTGLTLVINGQEGDATSAAGYSDLIIEIDNDNCTFSGDSDLTEFFE